MDVHSACTGYIGRPALPFPLSLMKNSLKASLAALTLVAGATGAYWYWSPYVALSSLQTAAKERDAERVNQYVDYPKLRESMKGQLSAKVMGDMKTLDGNPFAGLGASLGLMMVNGLVDSLVRPEVMMAAMTTGELRNQDTAASLTSAAPSADKYPARWKIERRGTDRVTAYVLEATGNEPFRDAPGFVFRRQGFATGKLTEIQLNSLR